MFLIAAFACGLIAIFFAEAGGEMCMTGVRRPGLLREVKVARFLAVLFISIAIAFAVSGASH